MYVFYQTIHRCYNLIISGQLNDEIEYNLDSKIIEFSLDVFRDKLGPKPTYTPRHITANIIPKLKKDLSKYYKSFDISYLGEGKQKVVGYRLTW